MVVWFAFVSLRLWRPSRYDPTFSPRRPTTITISQTATCVPLPRCIRLVLRPSCIGLAIISLQSVQTLVMGTQAICLDGLTNPELAYLPGKIFHLAYQILYGFRITLRCGRVLLSSAVALQHATQHGKDCSGN